MLSVAYEAMRFAQKLDYLIGLRRTSQSELSRRTGIAQSAISEMTKDKRRPYMDQSFKLANALNVPLSYLADDSIDELPPETFTAAEAKVWEAVRLIGPEEAYRRILQGASDSSSRPPFYATGQAVESSPDSSRGRNVG